MSETNESLSDVTPEATNENEIATESTQENEQGNAETGGQSHQKQGAKAGGKSEQKSQAQQVRELAEGDLDAIVSVKVDGKVEKMTAREALKLVQSAKSSTERFNKASELSKNAQNMFRLAAENPDEFFRRTGRDPIEYYESRLAEIYEERQLSPEQKEFRRLQKLEQDSLKEKAEAKKREENERLTKAEQQEMQKLDQEIGEALKEFKDSGIPTDKYFTAQIAARILSASKQGKDLSAKEAAASIKSDFQATTRRVFDQMDAKAIHEMLGDTTMKKLREFDVQRVTGQVPTSQTKGPGPRPASNNKKQSMNEHQWRKHIEDLSSNFKD